MTRHFGFLSLLLFVFSCAEKQQPTETHVNDSLTFQSDVNFLKRFTNIITLADSQGMAQVAISPALQGRVMTSSASGANGRSFGWINRPAFVSGDTSEHINVFGGEDRFWLGPEGGQFSIYFKKGAAFNLDNWFVPPLIDIDPFNVVDVKQTEALFSKNGRLTNYSGSEFIFSISRRIKLLSQTQVAESLSAQADKADIVAYQSVNSIKNTGDKKWTKDTGLLSIWILGMFNPADDAVVIVPLKGPDVPIDEVLNDRYFGKVPADRLAVKGGRIFFKADGKHRSKIGLRPEASTGWLGSFDPESSTLTLVNYTLSQDVPDYVNSLWEVQEEPYRGDALNAYNDGPPSPGVKPLGPFYELETSSPAISLSPGDSVVHVHTTYHIQGDTTTLNKLMRQFLNTTTREVQSVFKKM
jgi:hypothetical protein